MAFRPKISAALAKAIDRDMAELDTKKTESKPEAKPTSLESCDCTGGPGLNNEPGTGLVDDATLCPKCNGTGKVSSAQG